MTEPRYTLADARRMLAREACDRDGHEITQERFEAFGGAAPFWLIRCERCDAHFEEVRLAPAGGALSDEQPSEVAREGRAAERPSDRRTAIREGS